VMFWLKWLSVRWPRVRGLVVVSSFAQSASEPKAVMFCQNTCKMGGKSEDKIRVNLEAIALEEARREAEEAQRNEEEQQRAEEEERERLALAKAEEERRRQQEEEEARRKLEEEEARRKQEEEAQRKQEAERLERERIEEEQRLQRKEALDQFYQRYGFAGVNEPRKGASCQVLKTSVTYPLHQAAELANEQIVEYLLQDGAMVNQTNSSKLTAAQVAKKRDKAGSHTGVLRLLGPGVRPEAGGA